MPGAPDPVADLRERVQAMQDAAQRLAAEAAHARRADAAGAVPPAGWATAQDRAATRHELEEVVALVATLRDLLPAELQQQVAEVLKQVLLLLRALLDWWVERLDAVGGGGAAAAGDGARPPRAPQDIPVR